MFLFWDLQHSVVWSPLRGQISLWSLPFVAVQGPRVCWQTHLSLLPGEPAFSCPYLPLLHHFPLLGVSGPWGSTGRNSFSWLHQLKALFPLMLQLPVSCSGCWCSSQQPCPRSQSEGTLGVPELVLQRRLAGSVLAE